MTLRPTGDLAPIDQPAAVVGGMGDALDTTYLEILPGTRTFTSADAGSITLDTIPTGPFVWSMRMSCPVGLMIELNWGVRTIDLVANADGPRPGDGVGPDIVTISNTITNGAALMAELGPGPYTFNLGDEFAVTGTAIGVGFRLYDWWIEDLPDLSGGLLDARVRFVAA